MSTREDILAKCRAAIKERFAQPSLDDINPITWDDPIQQFKTALEKAGGKAIDVQAGSDLNAVLKGLFPHASSFAGDPSSLPIVNMDPDTLNDIRQMESLDVGIVKGEVGVAENACIWVPQTMREKAMCFICEHLVILLPRKCIVNNMHEAYKKIVFNDYGYGCFISGPSKTADIAQVLVMGAQAARSATVLLLP